MVLTKLSKRHAGTHRRGAYSKAGWPGSKSTQGLEEKSPAALKNGWEKGDINIFPHAFV